MTVLHKQTSALHGKAMSLHSSPVAPSSSGQTVTTFTSSQPTMIDQRSRTTMVTIRLSLTPMNVAIVLLFFSACLHSFAHYFYFCYRLVFGYLYPSYASFKAIKNKDVREYARWMMYWVVFGIFSSLEVFSDVFLGFWFPFYYESKIMFILWLTSSYGNGAKIMYKHVVQPEFLKREQMIDSYIQTAKDWGVSSAVGFCQRAGTFMNRFMLQALHMAQAAILNNMMTYRGPQQNFAQMAAGMDQRMLGGNPTFPGQSHGQRSHSLEEHQVDFGAQFFEQRWFSQDDLSNVGSNIRIREKSVSHSNLASGDNRHCPTPVEEEGMIIDSSSSVPDLTNVDGDNKVKKTRGRKPREKAQKDSENEQDNYEPHPRKRLVRGAAKKAQKKISSLNKEAQPSDVEMD